MAENTFFSKIKKFHTDSPIWSALISIVIVGFVLLWGIMIFLSFWTHHNEDSIVPEIKAMTYDKAVAVLHDANLEIEISDSVYDTSVAPGTIIESWPKAGSQVKRGRKVYVTLTAFTPKNVTITMPVAGVSSRQAISYLNALGITSVRIINVPSEYVDLVETARWNGRPIGVGSEIPVDAEIVLEVGYHYEPDPEEEYEGDYGDVSSEDLIMQELSDGHSVYVDDEP